MKYGLLIILTLLTSTAFGQEDATADILEIIRVGLADKKLPKELINNVDSLYAARTNGTYSSDSKRSYPLTVGVEGAKYNGLKHHYHIKWDSKEIWVWGEEDFFAYDIYWLTPTSVKAQVDRISFDFVTHTWGDKKVKYYKGTIKAEQIQGKWTIKNIKLKETKNNFDEWQRTVDGRYGLK